MSAEENFSRNSTDACEDELYAWLQYPVDDLFDKKYCSDVPVRSWTPLPNTGVVRSLPDEGPSAGHSIAETGILTCTGSGSSRTPVQESAGAKTFLRSPSVADNALAHGAARAIGRSSQVGHDVFNKVKTSMQLQPTPQISIPCSSLKPFDHKASSAKPNVLVPHTPRPLAGGLHSPRLHSSDTFSIENSKHAPLDKFRKAHETHAKQLSQTERGKSSNISEVDSVRRVRDISASSGSSKALGNAREEGSTMTGSGSWDVKGKMGWADGMLKDPPSYSGGSQTSLSLSFRDTTYYGKRKYEESELQSKDAGDRAINTEVPRKSTFKRNRVPEVHNLSEKNRRNKINDKLKTLQDLIPNSSKTDKASVLDEAIEYMKTLQMQLQMVSMRSTMNVSPMMMPMGFPQTPMHMGPLHSVGLGVPIGHPGMAMGLGMGMSMDMGLMPQSGWAAPFQPGPVAVTQYGVPFQTGIMASVHNSNQACDNVGDRPANHLDLMQKFHEPSEQVHARSLRNPHVHQCQQPKPGQQDFDQSSFEHEEQVHF